MRAWLGTILAPWHWTQRWIDLTVLWPACKREAAARDLDMDHAKAAFAMHVFRDYAWIALGEDEIKRRIDALD